MSSIELNLRGKPLVDRCNEYIEIIDKVLGDNSIDDNTLNNDLDVLRAELKNIIANPKDIDEDYLNELAKLLVPIVTEVNKEDYKLDDIGKIRVPIREFVSEMFKDDDTEVKGENDYDEGFQEVEDSMIVGSSVTKPSHISKDKIEEPVMLSDDIKFALILSETFAKLHRNELADGGEFTLELFDRYISKAEKVSDLDLTIINIIKDYINSSQYDAGLINALVNELEDEDNLKELLRKLYLGMLYGADFEYVILNFYKGPYKSLLAAILNDDYEPSPNYNVSTELSARLSTSKDFELLERIESGMNKLPQKQYGLELLRRNLEANDKYKKYKNGELLVVSDSENSPETIDEEKRSIFTSMISKFPIVVMFALLASADVTPLRHLNSDVQTLSYSRPELDKKYSTYLGQLIDKDSWTFDEARTVGLIDKGGFPKAGFDFVVQNQEPRKDWRVKSLMPERLMSKSKGWTKKDIEESECCEIVDGRLGFRFGYTRVNGFIVPVTSDSNILDKLKGWDKADARTSGLLDGNQPIDGFEFKIADQNPRKNWKIVRSQIPEEESGEKVKSVEIKTEIKKPINKVENTEVDEVSASVSLLEISEVPLEINDNSKIGDYLNKFGFTGNGHAHYEITSKMTMNWSLDNTDLGKLQSDRYDDAVDTYISKVLEKERSEEVYDDLFDMLFEFLKDQEFKKYIEKNPNKRKTLIRNLIKTIEDKFKGYALLHSELIEDLEEIVGKD